ncbi:MAG: hypothetical protein AAFQ22_08485 [Pseudomonadota bacterium]
MRRPGQDHIRLSFNCADVPDDIKIRPARASRHKAVYPMSFRVSASEKAALKKLAGTQSLSSFIKARVFSDAPMNKTAKPSEIAMLLAQLGSSDLTNSLKDIAASAKLGTLPVTPDVLESLETACEDLRTIRKTLLQMLGSRKAEQ